MVSPSTGFDHAKKPGTILKAVEPLQSRNRNFTFVTQLPVMTPMSMFCSDSLRYESCACFATSIIDMETSLRLRTLQPPQRGLMFRPGFMTRLHNRDGNISNRKRGVMNTSLRRGVGGGARDVVQPVVAQSRPLNQPSRHPRGQCDVGNARCSN